MDRNRHVKKYFLLLTLFVLAGCQHPSTNDEPQVGAPLTVSAAGFDGRSVLFIPQKNYVAMPLPFAPFSDLHRHLIARVETEQGLNSKLISRGEAHVTVLTPPEFDQLKSLISIDEINSIANALDIQNSKITPVCLGRGDAVVEGKHEQTYYVVVEAPKLLEIRRTIAETFVKRGGSLDISAASSPASSHAAFDAENFYPHVTVGFTKRDLFDQDGVIKSKKSCVYSLDF